MSRVWIISFLALIAVFLPVWSYSQNWGYQASAGIGAIFLIFLLLNKFHVI